MLADDFQQETEWQQVSSNLQDSHQYSGRSFRFLSVLPWDHPERQSLQVIIIIIINIIQSKLILLSIIYYQTLL